MIRRSSLGALALLAVVPATASSQTTAAPEEALREVRAEILTEQAYLMAGQRHDFATAATWLREAATLRAPGPETVHALMDAGHFHWYAERSALAASAFGTAGELALGLGDRDTAIRAFRNAAFAADRVGDGLTARRFLARSEQLRAEAAVASATVVAQDG